MTSRAHEDSFMEDSEETCPLCVEEFDLSDRNFRPCPCGYQICQFCYNNIKNNMNGLCPACRRPYDDKNIEWKIISPEEFKADVANIARKKAAARQKEAERRQVETANRKHLQGLRVVQRNLVYITGMSTEGVPDEQLEEQLKGSAVFGQYGRIIKLSANKLKDTGGGNAALAIFITFADEDSASRCIAVLDGRPHQGRILKAQHGTTKYCSAFLRNENCNNRNCTFLHETGEDRDSFSRQELSSLNAASSQTRPQPTTSNSRSGTSSNILPQSTLAASQPISVTHRSEAMSRSDSGDGPALPSTANWAKNPQIQQSRRSSQAASRATPSPQATNVRTVTGARSEGIVSSKIIPDSASKDRELVPPQEEVLSEPPQKTEVMDESQSQLDISSQAWLSVRVTLVKACSEPLSWILDPTVVDDEVLRAIETHPPLIESNGGLARMELWQKQAKQRKKQEEARNLLQGVTLGDDDEHRISGSLQLGGEPDIGEDVLESARSRVAGASVLSQQPFDANAGTAPSFVPSTLANEFSNLDGMNRSMTPHQGVSLLKGVQDNDPILQQFQRAPNTSQHHSTLSNPFQGQNPVLSGHSRHGRQSSRYTFTNDAITATTTVKPTANSQLLAQQPAMIPTQNKSYPTQPNIQPGFYSGVQGPPPGLKSSGTPPISGGGMFGQGHGFTNAMGGNLNFGIHGPTKAGVENETMLIRGRAVAGGGLGPEVGKREFNISSESYPYTSLASLNTLYGLQTASSGASERPASRQKRKGKKHRQANPSSSGGSGIVDLADPSIFQARMHHNGVGQGPYSASQGQGSHWNFTEEAKSTYRNLDQTDTPLAGEDRYAITPLSTPALATLPTLDRLEDFPPLTHAKGTQLSEDSSVAGNAASPRIALTAKQSYQDRLPESVNGESNIISHPRIHSNITERQAVPRSSIINPLRSLSHDHLEDLTTGLATSTDQNCIPTKSDDTAASQVRAGVQINEERKSQLSKASTDVASHDLNQDVNIQDEPPAVDATPLNSTSGIVRPLRTLRVIDTPKADTTLKNVLGKSSSQTESSTPFSVPESHEVSRRPSLTSINIPSTPSNELHSETASYADSHPDSPAGSKSGTGFSRMKSKSQAKKERRVRRAEGSRPAEVVETTPSEPTVVQEAIIGRKKKAKKDKPTSPTRKVKTDEDRGPDLQDAKPVHESELEKPAIDVVTRRDMSQADQTSLDKQTDNFQVNSRPTEEGAKSSKASKSEIADDPPATLTDRREWVDVFSIGEMLDDMIRKKELQAYVADLVLNPPGLKASVLTPLKQTMVPQLTPEQNASLDSGEPVIVESVVYDSVDGLIRSPHPYPYSVILPNSERTVFPMATRQEADLHKILFLNSKTGSPPSTQSPSVHRSRTTMDAQPLYELAAADVSLLHFSSTRAKSYGDSGKSRMALEHQTGRDLDNVQGPNLREYAMNTDAIIGHWMEDSSREIHSIDAALGGNHFERSRATALGHGPVRLETPNIPGPFSGPAPAPPLPLSTHPILGTRAPDVVAGAATSRPTVSQNERDFMDVFKRAISVLSQPLKSQNLLQDMETMTLAEVERKLGEIEDYVVQLKKEADNADKKVLMLSKKYSKQMKAQSKVNMRWMESTTSSD